MKDLIRRLVVGTIAIFFLTSILLFAFQPIFQYVVCLIVAALASIAVWEYEQLVIAKGGRMIIPALMIATVAQCFAFFIKTQSDILQTLPLIVFFVALLVVFALHFGRQKGAVVDLAVSSFGLLYIAVPMGMLLGILYMPGVDGRFWIGYLLIVTKMSDIGAYFAGNLFGKHKLAPSISPKKTIEGAICGLISSLLASYIFHLFFPLSTLEWICLGSILGIVGQFGDLSESLLKRDANKKDSNTLPGLGGVLDAVDSLLFNIPIIYIYLQLTAL